MIDPRIQPLIEFTIECCRERRKASYREAWRRVNSGRGQIGGLLYAVNLATHKPLNGLLLSSVVKHSWEDWPGDQYFDCAIDLGYLRADADRPTRRVFWQRQGESLFERLSDEEQLDDLYDRLTRRLVRK